MEKNTKLPHVSKWSIFGTDCWFLKQKGIYYCIRKKTGDNYIRLLERKKDRFLGEDKILNTIITMETCGNKFKEERRLQMLCDKAGHENADPRINMYIFNCRKKIAEFEAELEGYNAIFEDRKELVIRFFEECVASFLVWTIRMTKGEMQKNENEKEKNILR